MKTQTRILRTPTRAEGGITPEEKRQMDAIAERWTANAMRTDRIDPAKIVPAIQALYAAAGKKAPRVVIAPSPLVMATAYGFAAAIWHARKNPQWGASVFDLNAATYDATYAATRAATDAATDDATRAATDAATDAATRAATRAATDDATRAATDDATDAATRAATRAAVDDATYDAATRAATRAAVDDATYDAVDDATYAATYAAVDDATYAATDDATRAATYAATYDATYAATDDATYDATDDATRAATDDATYAATYAAVELFSGWAREIAAQIAPGNPNLQKLMLSCVQNWWRSYQGGNMWSAWASYLAAARDVLGLRLPQHEKYQAWEDCALNGGFRVLHEEFCIVSDLPAKLCKDDQNRPHCDDGPSHLWCDGWALWFIHGVRVNRQIVEAPHTLTIKQIEDESNQEVRRVMMERFGIERFIKESGAQIIHADTDPQNGDERTLYRKEVADDEPVVMVAVKNSTPEPDGSIKDYFIRVPPAMKTTQEALAWTFGMEPHEYAPIVQS